MRMGPRSIQLTAAHHYGWTAGTHNTQLAGVHTDGVWQYTPVPLPLSAPWHEAPRAGPRGSLLRSYIFGFAYTVCLSLVPTLVSLCPGGGIL